MTRLLMVPLAARTRQNAGFPRLRPHLDSSRLQRLLAARGWLGRFNPVILNRAMDDVRSERVIALRRAEAELVVALVRNRED